MPGQQGTELLEKVRRLSPNILRILVTAYADLDSTIEAVNTGAIYKYIPKPWRMQELKINLCRGLEFYELQEERETLLLEKVSFYHNMIIADRLLSLSAMSEGLNHHIRNALVAIRTFLELVPLKLEEEKIDPEILRDPDFWNNCRDRAENQVGKIVNLLGDLWRATGKTKTLFTDSINLSIVLSKVIEALQKSLDHKKITIENNIPSDFPAIQGDKKNIARLFELLLQDELVTLPSACKIRLSAKMSENSSGQPYIAITLQDNGPGLPQEDLQSVFNPFYFRGNDPKELGINLMACYFIVYHHGGHIEAKSSETEGTEFKITLPTNANTNMLQEQSQDLLQKFLFIDSRWNTIRKGLP
ncbi:MAG: response regulator [Kiritimatiellae bacterium]|nr:response regulator [Kiritimatiellia bacterium]